MKRFPIAIVLAIAVCAVTATIRAAQDNSNRTHAQMNAPEPPMAGIHWARDHAPAARPGGGGGSPNLLYHDGPVMTQPAYVEAIYWGTKWGDASFVGDKRTGLKSFYEGLSNSSYADTNTEYTDLTGHVTTGVTVAGDHLDLSTAPKNGSRTSTILEEVCSHASTLVENGYYPVYVDSPRGRSGYCAWHSAGTCSNGTTVQFAFFYNLDGDAGCDPQDPSTGHSQGLEALANVSGHELSEAVTDPHLSAWYDANGQENSDKCAWAFATQQLTFSNGSTWKVQGNWSNAAFDAGTGYANNSGQKGCIDGGNYK
jgi:hypothetical protein